jgi:hypothetical protein
MTLPLASFQTSRPTGAAAQRKSSRSILKRALLGLVLLFVMVSGGAWLMHAGIEAEADGLRGGDQTETRQ